MKEDFLSHTGLANEICTYNKLTRRKYTMETDAGAAWEKSEDYKHYSAWGMEVGPCTQLFN